jgi:hypothetical protein
MKEHFLYLIDDEIAVLTREEAVAIKFMHPEKDIWNAYDALDMEPILMDTENDAIRNI